MKQNRAEEVQEFLKIGGLRGETRSHMTPGPSYESRQVVGIA